MTSTIKVNTIQNTCGADIIKESSNTITIGASGDTVTLASGASQSGFGRTGAVDWNTTVKTADFTATDGDGFFINAAGGDITVTLPSSPSAGAIVGLSDYNGSATSNTITIARNGSNINGNADNLILSKDNAAGPFKGFAGKVNGANVGLANLNPPAPPPPPPSPGPLAAPDPPPATTKYSTVVEPDGDPALETVKVPGLVNV